MVKKTTELTPTGVDQSRDPTVHRICGHSACNCKEYEVGSLKGLKKMELCLSKGIFKTRNVPLMVKSVPYEKTKSAASNSWASFKDFKFRLISEIESEMPAWSQN